MTTRVRITNEHYGICGKEGEILRSNGGGEFLVRMSDGLAFSLSSKDFEVLPETLIQQAITITNIQTDNPAIIAPILDGWTYIEQHGKYTIQASVSSDDTYNAVAWHVFDGCVGEVVDSACLDDALAELETQYGEQIRGWHAPQTFGL